jgi:succinoglycan biosynthesis transport protein ExoP
LTDQTAIPGKAARLGGAKSNLTVREVLTPVFYHWRLALVVFLIPVCLALVAAALAKPVFTAQSRLLILLGDDYVFSSSVTSNGTPQTFDKLQIVHAEMDILGARDLQEEAINAVGLNRIYPKTPPGPAGMAAALDKLGKDLKIENVPLSNTIDLSLRNGDPQVAAQLLNKIVELYLRNRRLVFQRADLKVAGEQQDMLRGQLAELETRISDLSNIYLIGDYNQELITAQTQVTTLTGQLAGQDQALATAQGRAGKLRQEIEGAPETITLDSSLTRSQQAEALTNALMALKEKRRIAAARFREDYPLVVELDQEIAGLEATLQAAPQQEVGAVRRGANPVYQQLDGQLATTNGDAAGLQQSRASLTQALNAANTRLSELIRVGPQYRELLRNRALIEGSYQDVAKKAEDARLEDTMAGAKANVKVLQAADPPTKGQSGRMILLAAGVVLGLCGAFATIVLAATGSQVMVTPRDVEDRLDVPILGTIPQGPHDALRTPSWRPEPARMSEDDANILLRLLRSITGSNAGVIQFISANEGEGTTSLALDLAMMALHKTDQPVLIIDADPRSRHGLVARFARAGAKISTEQDPGRIPQINGTKLYVTMPMSKPDVIVPETAWSAFLNGARQRFPLIIIDAPPPVRSSAGLLLAPLADLTLVVVAAESTRVPVSQNLVRRLENAGGTVAGALLNKRRFHIPNFIYSRV